MRFFRHSLMLGSPEELTAPLDHVLRLFRPTMTPSMENKLLLYLLTLYLMLDDFAVDPAPVAKDLSLPIMKSVDVLPCIGCIIHSVLFHLQNQ